MKLFGIGKSRFATINSAVRRQEEHCPYDGRYVEKGPQLPSEKRMKVHEFLMQLYLESAEHIPDGVNSNKRPRQGLKKLDRRVWTEAKSNTFPMVPSTTILCAVSVLESWIGSVGNFSAQNLDIN